MERARLEEAITRLEHLLALGESSEDEYQEYLEENSIVFNILGYSKAVPKPRLPLPDGGYLEPDFLVQRPDQLFEVFEIKTPQEKLVKAKRHRERLYCDPSDYVAQTIQYAEYFDDGANRELVRKIHSLDVQKGPDSTLLMGTDEGVDKKLLHSIARRLKLVLRIMTYDDLRSVLQFQHAKWFGASENLTGASWHGLIKVERIADRRRKYIFDHGDQPSSNRWSIYIDEHDRLCCEVIGSDGISYVVSVPLGTRGFHFGRSFYLACEFGNSDTFAVLQILIDNRIAAKLQLASPIPISRRLHSLGFVIGTDIEKKYFGSFTLAAVAVYGQILDFRTRRGIAQYFLKELLPHGQ